MAKGDVTLKFDADTAAFIQKVMQARSALDDTAKKAREAGQEISKTGSAVESVGETMNEVARHAASVIGIPLSIAGALDIAFKTAENAMERWNKKADEAANRQITLQQALAKTGQMGQFVQVKSMLGDISKSTERNKGRFGGSFDDQAVEGVFAQIHAASGGRTTLASEFSGTRAALLGIGGNMAPADATALGTATAKLKSIMPTLSDDDAGRIALFLQTNAPEIMSDPKALSVIARSETPLKAARFFASGYQQFQNTRGEASLVSLVESRRATWDQIFDRPDSLPMEARTIAKAVSAGEEKLRDPGSLQQFVRTAVANEAVAGELVRMKRATEVRTEKLLDEGQDEALAGRTIGDRAFVQFKERSALRDTPPYTWLAGAAGGFMSNISRGGMTQGGGTDRLVIQLMEEQNELARTNAEHMREIRRKVGEGNPTLNNDKDGQK